MNQRTKSKRALVSALVIVLVFVILALMTGMRRVSANTFTVTNTGDNGGVNPAVGAGTGTLRQAIIDANANAGADTITFAVTGTITLAAALPPIAGDVTIIGPGSAVLAVSGASSFRVLKIAPAVTASISGLTISNGNAPADGRTEYGGGGIYNEGTLTVTNSTFSNNAAFGNGDGFGPALGGGGIYNWGTLTVTNSTFSGNSAFASGLDMDAELGGGGILNSGKLTVTNSTFSANSAFENARGNVSTIGGGGIFNLGPLTVTNSTFSNNSAFGTRLGIATLGGGGIANLSELTVINSTFSDNFTDGDDIDSLGGGGGIANQAGRLTVTNSTFSGNSAASGGDIYNGGELTVTSSTFSNNSAASGGGIFNTRMATFKNSIIANDPSGGNCAGTVAITPVGVNFSTDGTCAGFTQVTAQQLNLGPLADNGGPTQTHALLAGSIAIDAVSDCTDTLGNPITTDQRGLPRPIDGNGDGTALCDVGAFEAAACISGDTSPPQITCPATAVTFTAITCPPSINTVVNFPAPTVSDNCPGVVTVCNPPSGSTLPVGTTTVTCTATDVGGNTASCSFTISAFNACIQDDSDPTSVILFNTFTGEYRVCCNGVLLASGTGTLLQQGCDFTLQHYPGDRRVTARWSSATFKGSGSLQKPAGTLRCTIADRDIRNNSCQCQ